LDERIYWLAWSQIEGVGPTLLFRIKQQFGKLSEAWTAHISDLMVVEGIGEQTARSLAEQRSRFQPEQFFEEHRRKNPCFWTPEDADYPRLLLEISDPPPILYYRGKVEPPENRGIIPAIAIVGTRTPSDYGRRWTRRICRALTEAGFTVISGLAQGIDTEAHRTCVQQAGRTWAVLGTGVDVIYPASNLSLAQQIVNDGLLVSEYPAGTQPDRMNFPRRNRIIAGLSRATLVLEAPYRSGALITARLANDYGRDVYALPGALDNENCLGCLDLLNHGAQVILGDRTLIDALGYLPQLQLETSPNQTGTEQLSLLDAGHSGSSSTPSTIPLTPDLEKVFHQVPLEAIALDAIVERSGLETGQVLGSLAQLELLGLVTQLPGMRYQRS
jgi:DNA processing protein